jgi:hypothetical protein
VSVRRPIPCDYCDEPAERMVSSSARHRRRFSCDGEECLNFARMEKPPTMPGRTRYEDLPIDQLEDQWRRRWRETPPRPDTQRGDK